MIPWAGRGGKPLCWGLRGVRLVRLVRGARWVGSLPAGGSLSGESGGARG